MKSKIRILISLLFVFLVSSCSGPAVSVNPITSLEDATHDKRLVGAWQALDEGDTAVFLIIGPPEKNISRVLYMGVSESEFGVYNLAMFPSRLQSGNYLNVFYPRERRDFDLEEREFVFKEEKISKDFFGDNYMFLKYEFLKPDVLVLRIFNDKLIKEAIEKKQLKGDTTGESMLITDSSENISAFAESKRSSDLSRPAKETGEGSRPGIRGRSQAGC
jgi:hypothetical protein